MEPTPTLAYGLTPKPSLRRILRWLSIPVYGLAVIFILALIPWGTCTTRIDAITGTEIVQTTILGFEAEDTVKPSPLDLRLKATNQSRPPVWHVKRVRRLALANQFVSYAERRLPLPILDFRKKMGPFVSKASDAEVTAFADVMQNGTETEQRPVIDAARKETLAAPSSRPASVR